MLQWTTSGVIRDDSGTVIATVLENDVLSFTDQPSDHTQIIPCGKHTQIDPEPSAQLLSQWSQDSWEPFNTVIDRIMSTNTNLVVLPGAGGRLSDAICTLSWATAHPKVPLLIDPIRWLTPSMLDDLQDHLIRFTSLCSELPNIWGVVLRSLETTQDNQLSHVPLGQGLINDHLLDQTLRTIPSPRWIECR